MKYKIIGVFVLLSVLLISAPKAAKAYTLDDLMAQITSLQQEVSSLQSAIALKAVTMSPLPAPAVCSIASFDASSTSINVGGSSTLSWTTTGCSTVEITSTNSGVLSDTPTSGSITVSPTSTSTYTLTAVNSTTPKVFQAVTVAVNPSTGCNSLYWTDNNNKTCASSKQFCGTYMYQGLNTFGTQAECQASLLAPVTVQVGDVCSCQGHTGTVGTSNIGLQCFWGTEACSLSVSAVAPINPIKTPSNFPVLTPITSTGIQCYCYTDYYGNTVYGSVTSGGACVHIGDLCPSTQRVAPVHTTVAEPTLTRGVKVVLVENPGGACSAIKTPSTGLCRWGNLIFGTEGSQVKAYQEILQAAGYLPASAKIDGSYGAMTKSAVTKFQTDNSLDPTGNVDEPTQAALLSVIKAQSQNNPFEVTQPAGGILPDVSIVYHTNTCDVFDNRDGSYQGSGTSVYDTASGAGCLVGTAVWHISAVEHTTLDNTK
jgi:hypothetical protein